jgi:small subunit ribosomal protein S3
MGQKVNPIGFRLGINRTWDSRWFADNAEYGKLLHEDLKIREYLLKELKQAGCFQGRHRAPAPQVPRDDPHRASGPDHRQEGRRHREAAPQAGGHDPAETHLNIVEVRKPEIDATWSPQSIAQQLERRVAFRRAMKRAVQSAMRLGAEGIRINCGGRLGGAEIARTEWYREGRVPLHTLRADIDYGVAEAKPPPTASAASRSGSSRARSWSTIPWRRERRATEGDARGGQRRRENA